MWHQNDLIAGQACAGVTLGNSINLAVNTGAVRAERQKCRTMQQGFKIDIAAFADQFECNLEGLIERLTGSKFEYLEVVRKTFDFELENNRFADAGHTHFPVPFLGSGLCVGLQTGAVRRIG